MNGPGNTQNSAGAKILEDVRWKPSSRGSISTDMMLVPQGDRELLGGGVSYKQDSESQFS